MSEKHQAFVDQIANLLIWDFDNHEGTLYAECDAPGDGYLDSHCTLMDLIEQARVIRAGLKSELPAGSVDLGELEAAALDATDGPWETSVLLGADGPKEWTICSPEGGDMLADLSGCPNEEANARFIEAANPAAVLELIHRIRNLESREVLPGATASEIMHVMMQDVVGDYDVPDGVPEWVWVEAHASYVHVRNGEDGIWEFVLNLAMLGQDETAGNAIPEKLLPVIRKAQAESMAYIIFHQGT